MTTQDILLLSFVISKEAAFCRGESDWWPPRDDEISLVKTLFDEGSCIDYLSQGEKVKPVAMKLRKALREFLDCASDELIDGNPKAMTVRMTVPFCEAWLNWIDAYFPIDPNCQQQPHQEQDNEEPVMQDVLPLELDTDKARKYFPRAEKAGYMDGNIWKKPIVQLAYFCSKIYSNPRPTSALEEFFGVKNLSAQITQVETNEPKRRATILWREAIDDAIFYD